MTPDEFKLEYFEWDQETGPGSYEKMLSIIKDMDWSIVKANIVKIKYFYFLKSSYWRIISEEVKRRNGRKCSSCGSRKQLQAHHGANAIHGEEHSLIGLECVCDACHRAVHKDTIDVRVADRKQKRVNQKQSILDQLPEYPHSINEDDLDGQSFIANRKLLEELEHERKIVIRKETYNSNKIYRL